MSPSTKNLKSIAKQAKDDVNALLVSKLTKEQEEKVATIIEDAVVKALLEGQHRAVDAALRMSENEEDTAHKIARKIRQKNDLLIANLTSLR